MNWFNPPKRGETRITIASDWAPIRAYESLVKADPLAVYGDLLPLFKESDLNIVNVECVLGNSGAPIPKAGPCLRGDASAIAALTLVPFHVATLANNHSMDYGPESLAETLDLLRKSGVQTVGAGMDGKEAALPLIIERASLRIGIINCGEAEACASLFDSPGAHLFEADHVADQIRELMQITDAVIVIHHGGREHAAMPPPYLVADLRRLAKAGATAIIAHHPHVPQGMEIHCGVPIAYSQGNFVFSNGEDYYYQNTGYLVHLDFEGKQLSDASFSPYRLGADGLSLLHGSDAVAFTAHLQRLSSLLEDPEAIESVWNAFIDEFGIEAVVRHLERGIIESGTIPLSGASRLHHYFFCPAHRNFFQQSFARLARGRDGDSPKWARELVRETKTRLI